MSMVCSLLGLSPDQIEKLRQNPSLARSVIKLLQDQATSLFYEKIMPRQSEASRTQLAIQLKAAQDGAAAARAMLIEFGPLEEPLSIEKSWHMLHYLFTGKVGGDGSAAATLLGGAELGPDLGYGPARLHNTGAARRFSDFLDTVDLDRLRERVDLARMTLLHVYGMPFGPDSPVDYERELRDEVAVYFPLMRAYAAKVSQMRYGLLIWLE